MEEAFRNDWIHLLNLVNVISPCQYNKVVNTTSSSMQRMKNLEEYQRTLKFCKYKYMNDFAADEFLKDELSREALIQLIRSLLYLKKRYEMIGVRKDKSQEIRSFYVLSTDEADCYNSIQEEALQENVKIENVFWLDHKKRLESFQKNQEEEEEEEEEEKESEKKKDSNVSSSSFSKSSSMSPLSSSEGNEGIQETKDENQKDQVKKVEKAKNKTSSGSSSNSSNSGSGIEFSDETQKKTEKEKVDQKETKKKNKETITKKNKSSSGSSSNSSSSSSRENEDSNENNQGAKDESQKIKKKVEKPKNKTSSGSSSNPSSSSEENGKETNNKRKGKEKEQEKGMEMETKQKNKEENEKSTKVPSTSEEGNENKTQKEVTRELKLAKGEHLYEILAYNSSNTEYFSRNLQEIFKIKNKNPNKYWYIYSVFFILNYLDEWRKQGNTNLLRGIRDKALGKKYEKFVQRAYSDAQDFAKNGKAIFKCFIGEPNSQTFREGELKILKKGIVISLTNMKGHFYKKKLSESMTFSLHKTDPFVISYEILKPPKCFPIKFQSEFDKILAIMTLIYFIKNRGDKRKIGHNPYNMTAHSVTKRVLPPLEIPNERFKKLISGTDYVNMKGNAKEILAKYYSQRGVNFLIAIVNIKEYPLVSGYIKVRENEIKIGCNKTTLFKVPFTHKPILMKNPNDSKVFLIRWTQNAMCGTSSEPAVSVMCKAVSERSLITKSIMYFIKNWQDKEKIKRNKKKSKKKDRKQRK